MKLSNKNFIFCFEKREIYICISTVYLYIYIYMRDNSEDIYHSLLDNVREFITWLWTMYCRAIYHSILDSVKEYIFWDTVRTEDEY
jgi:hypothetical protein